MCRFSGLVAFPFDNLTCPIEVGGWKLSGGQQGIRLDEGGFAFSDQEITSGASYQEYTIARVTAELVVYEYPFAPSEPWPIAVYRVTLSRQEFFYVPLSIVPGILITLLSFAVFWTDTHSADALGYGITVIVVNLLGNLVLIQMLPICGELIWIDIFATTNTFFCCLALMQSSFNIMLEAKDDHTLLPLWLNSLFSRLRAWLRPRLAACYRRARQQRFVASIMPDVSPVLSADEEERRDAMRKLSSTFTLSESVAGVIFRQRGKLRTKLAAKNGKPPEEATDEERIRKLTYFERIFFVLDTDCSLFIDADECETLLSYAVLDMPPLQRIEVLRLYDTAHDGKLNRLEFCQMCVDLLWDVDEQQLERALHNSRLVKSGQQRQLSRYWKDLARLTDSWARIIVPTIYFMALLIIFNLELSDNYGENSPMFQGLGPARLSAHGTRLLVFYILGCAFCLLMWYVMKMVAASEERRRKAATKRHVAVLSTQASSARHSPLGALPQPESAARRRGKFERGIRGGGSSSGHSLDPGGGVYRVEHVQGGSETEELQLHHEGAEEEPMAMAVDVIDIGS
jgi:hypothetical protein